MLCNPRKSGKPAFVIEYIWRENRIRSVRSGWPPPRRRQRFSATSSVAAAGLMSVGVMPRVNKWLASASADSDSSDPPTASPRAVRPLYLKSGIRLARQPGRRRGRRSRARQDVVEQALASHRLLEPGERRHDLRNRCRAVEGVLERALHQRHEARSARREPLHFVQVVVPDRGRDRGVDLEQLVDADCGRGTPSCCSTCSRRRRTSLAFSTSAALK